MRRAGLPARIAASSGGARRFDVFVIDVDTRQPGSAGAYLPDTNP